MSDESILELMSRVSVLEFGVALFFISALGLLLYSQKGNIMKHLNKWRKTKNEDDEFHALVYELKTSIEEIKKFQNQHTKDIESLKNTMVEIQRENSETKRVEIKEKIERIYRECHPAMKCTDMQLETLKELISRYEKHGGDNSFVHSTVEIEMYSWEVIKAIKDD